MDGWMDKQNVVYPYHEILFSLKTEEHSDPCYMDEPWRWYAKWNMSVTKGQILYDSTYMRYFTALEFIELESRVMVVRGSGRGGMQS